MYPTYRSPPWPPPYQLPNGQAGAPVTRPAGSPAAPVSAVGEVRASIVRFGVTAASLTAGQVMLGERDTSAAVKRALTGATLTELTTQALRAIQKVADMDAPLDPLFLASYGQRELQRYHDMILQAWLTGTVGHPR